MVIKRGGGVRLLNKKTCGGKKRAKWKSLVSVNRLWNKTEWRKENKKSSESWKKKKEEKKNKKSERRKKKELVCERRKEKELVWKKSERRRRIIFIFFPFTRNLCWYYFPVFKKYPENKLQQQLHLRRKKERKKEKEKRKKEKKERKLNIGRRKKRRIAFRDSESSNYIYQYYIIQSTK